MNILGNQNGSNRLKDGYASLGNLLATDSDGFNLTLTERDGVDAIETVLGSMTVCRTASCGCVRRRNRCRMTGVSLRWTRVGS